MAAVPLSLEKGVAMGGWCALGGLWNTTWQDLSTVAFEFRFALCRGSDQMASRGPF